MNIIIKRIVLGLLIITNCIAIFILSEQDAQKSSETSDVVVNKVINTISTINKKTKKEKIKDKVTFYVRKFAHFSIYALLGILLLCFLNTFNLTLKRKIILCLIMGLIYASSDEFHQSFVAGRSPEVRDVCVDTCGVLFGNLIIILITKFIYKFKSKKNERSV